MARRRTKNISLGQLDKDFILEKELQDIVSLWTLRLIIKLKKFNEFIDSYGRFIDDKLAILFDLQEYIDQDDFDKKEIYNQLQLKLLKLENRKRFTGNKTLKNNINKLDKLISLNDYEKQILEFLIISSQNEVLDKAVDMLGSELNTANIINALSAILNIPLKEVKKIFSSESVFQKSSIVTIDKNNTYSFDRKFDFITNEFADYMYSSDEDIETLLKDFIRVGYNSSLKIEDYNHIQKDLDILLPYMNQVFKTKKSGVNILLYGEPGTGKTELSKIIGNFLNVNIHEISHADQYDEPLNTKDRAKAYKISQYLLSKQKSLLVYDEAEDIFETKFNLFGQSKQTQKAWVNKILETNPVPTIWITNDIDSMDKAVIRRFDLSIEVPIPPKEKRVEIINNYSQNILDKQTIDLLSKDENIAPALISSTTKVVNSLNTKQNKTEIFKQVLNNTLKAQGYAEIKDKEEKSLLPNTYDASLVNCDVNLEDLKDGIQETSNARICIYGPAGTGKSAYAKYLAQSLDKKLIIKKGSDLFSMWVGGTEKNIAKAFEEAKKEDAVLVFDEVDSFLQDRNSANKNWEISQVNEMLVQMENFDGIFVATTNLMDNLDKASLRRFDLKMEFTYLESNQALKLFEKECEQLNIEITDISKSDFRSIYSLTPGDYAAVIRQNRFRPIKSDVDFLKRLCEEVEVKKLENNSSVMGFL